MSKRKKKKNKVWSAGSGYGFPLTKGRTKRKESEKLEELPEQLTLHNVFRLKEDTLIRFFNKYLTSLDYLTQEGYDYVYGAPEDKAIPVMLISHVDTVHFTKPEEIFHDPQQGVLWSPTGIGADDRAGVWGIYTLLEQGYRPHVLLTDGEESGGFGAKEASRDVINPGVTLLVELDRKNGTEAVFYDQDIPDLEEYVLQAGYKKASGTFTDISILCPSWKIPGVNLSCGYYNAHTTSEYLKLPELYESLRKVTLMLNSPPPKYAYKEHVRAYLPVGSYTYNYSTSTRGTPSVCPREWVEDYGNNLSLLFDDTYPGSPMPQMVLLDIPGEGTWTGGLLDYDDAGTDDTAWGLYSFSFVWSSALHQDVYDDDDASWQLTLTLPECKDYDTLYGLLPRMDNYG